jgi:hypothetical protein
MTKRSKRDADTMSAPNPAAVESDAGALVLTPDEDTGDRLLVYQGKDGVRVDLKVEGDTFWATQAQMAMMFGVEENTITYHLGRIYAEGELLREATARKIRGVRLEGGRKVSREIEYFDLNALISVGYRVGGPLGTMFRIWATERLFQLLTKGFVLDERRLKNPDGRPDYFDDLLDRIRDIRSSEKRMWMRVQELATFCNDFDADDPAKHARFFAEIQNTMHWAVSQKTAAEIVVDEVNADKNNAGVLHFDGPEPTVKEATIAKNLLGEPLIAGLNHITSLTLEFFESQAEQRRPTTLDEFLNKMRELVKLDGRPVKPAGHYGKITAQQAKEHAARELREWRSRRRAIKEAEGEKTLAALAKSLKSKPRKKK